MAYKGISSKLLMGRYSKASYGWIVENVHKCKFLLWVFTKRAEAKQSTASIGAPKLARFQSERNANLMNHCFTRVETGVR